MAGGRQGRAMLLMDKYKTAAAVLSLAAEETREALARWAAMAERARAMIAKREEATDARGRKKE